MSPALCSLCKLYIPSGIDGQTCFWLKRDKDQAIPGDPIKLCEDNDQFQPAEGLPLSAVVRAVAIEEKQAC